MNIFDLAQQFRRRLLAREREAAKEMIAAYSRAYERIRRSLDTLTGEIEAKQAAGEEVSQAWLLRQDRFQLLLNQVLAEINRFAQIAGGIIEAGQGAAIDQALDDSQDLLTAAADVASAASTFTRLNKSAVENLVGALSDGSPLADLLAELGPQAAGAVREGLIQGVVQGRGARAVAREIRGALDGSLFRAMRIARTEVIRSYRETTHHTYQENAEVLGGWIWLSALNERTCRACVAMHGTIHRLDERMKSHVQCRCSQVPWLPGVDYGIERGPEWFAKQPEEFQRQILDRAGEWEAYKSGQVALEDFVGLRTSAKWGDSYQALSLKRALAGDGKFPGDARPVVKVPDIVPPTSQPVPKPDPPRPAEIPATEARKGILAIDKKYRAKEDAAFSDFLRLSREFKRTQDLDTRTKAAEARQRAQDIQNTRRKESLELLAQPTEAKFKVSGDRLNVLAQEGIAAFRRLIGDRWLKDQTIKIVMEAADYRAEYDLQGGAHFATSDMPKVYVHELGHWLEDKEKAIFDKITEFYERRTAEDKVEKMGGGYKDSEKTKKDKFISRYMGKYYYTVRDGEPLRYGSEILSMGLEYFYNDPAELARKDPEYFDFIYNLVRGK